MVGLAAAASAAAAALLLRRLGRGAFALALLLDFRLRRAFLRHRREAAALRLGPPGRQLGGAGLAGLAAQQQEVVGGAEARMGQQALDPAALAVLEPRLQRPDLAHW